MKLSIVLLVRTSRQESFLPVRHFFNEDDAVVAISIRRRNDLVHVKGTGPEVPG